MRGIFKRTFSGFEPIDEDGNKILKRFKFGEIAELESKIKRNIKFHRKLFAIINLTFPNQDITKNENDFREAGTIASGYFHYQKQVDGTEIKRSDSISFANMDDITFESLYNKVFDVCLGILGCVSEDLERELLHFD